MTLPPNVMAKFADESRKGFIDLSPTSQGERHTLQHRKTWQSFMKVAANGCQRNCQVSSFVAMILAQAQDGITNLNIMLNAAFLSSVGFHLKRISSASFDLKRDLYLFYIFCCVRYFSPPCYRLLPYALARIGCYLFIYSYSLLYCKKNPLLLKNEHIVSKDFFEAEFELDGIESGKLESTSSRYLQHSVDTSRTRKISTHGLN